MKRKNLCIVIAVICLCLTTGVFANFGLRELTYNDEILDRYDIGMKNLINDKIESGMQIFYGDGITIQPTDLKRARAFTNTINLPGSGINYDLKFTSIGQTITSPCLFYATSNCTMKIYMSSTIKYDPSEIIIKVIDQTTGRTIYSETEYFEEVHNILPLSLTRGHSYYITATSTQLPSNAALLVMGE